MSCVLYSSCNKLERVDTPGRTFVVSYKALTHVPVKGTCDEASMLGIPIEDIDNDVGCIEQCKKQNACRFSFYTVDRSCSIFTSCQNFSFTNKNGLTFEMGKYTENK